MTTKHTGYVVGLMSGTSGDGIDAALVHISGLEPGDLRVNLQAFDTVPYSDDFRERLFKLFDPRTARVDEICRCNMILGELLAHAVLCVCKKAGVLPAQVDLVGSHGQTIHHLPPVAEGPQGTPSTLQIGEAAVIAERTGITTVSNFRTRDMAAGGEGAPLVPFADYCLFGHERKTLVIQNIGGIGNLTALPPGGDPGRILTFDTGPGNMVIDALSGELFGLPMDRDGAYAALGQPHEGLLGDLLMHPYYDVMPPKSTGRELFGAAYASQLRMKGEQLGLSSYDILATATALTVCSIRDQIERYVVPRMGWPARLVVAGGGAHNATLIRMLRDYIPCCSVEIHHDQGIPGDAKEAIAFAILAWRTWWLRSSNLPGVTGARHSVVLGSITPGERRPSWSGGLPS